MFPVDRVAAFVFGVPAFGKNDDGGSGNPDPTMKNIPGKPGDENVPPAGGESMAPADSKQPYAKPDDDAADTKPPENS